MRKTSNFYVENTLFQRLQKNEPSAQSELWQMAFGPLSQICFRIVKNSDDATDIVSSVISDFTFKYVMRLTKYEVVVQYMRLMTVRRALRFMQKTTLNQTMEGLEFEADSPSSEFKIMGSHLANCLQKLSDKARQALTLRYGAELTTDAIGKIVGDSKQYIGRLITQSLQSLRRCLGEK